jgi:hypothetical protein
LEVEVSADSVVDSAAASEGSAAVSADSGVVV